MSAWLTRFPCTPRKQYISQHIETRLCAPFIGLANWGLVPHQVDQVTSEGSWEVCIWCELQEYLARACPKFTYAVRPSVLVRVGRLCKVQNPEQSASAEPQSSDLAPNTCKPHHCPCISIATWISYELQCRHATQYVLCAYTHSKLYTCRRPSPSMHRQATGRSDVRDLHDGVVYLFCQETFRAQALGKVWLHRVLHSGSSSLNTRLCIFARYAKPLMPPLRLP